MLKIIVVLIVAAGLVVSVMSWNGESERQAQRATEQGRLLAELEALRNPDVSRLVDEWRSTYPTPSEDRLTELRVLSERVKADPASAAKYTAKDRQAKLDALPFESPLGTPKAKPGI